MREAAPVSWQPSRMAEAPESRTQPSRSTRETTGFEDREGHRAPFASSLTEGLRPSDSPTRALDRPFAGALRGAWLASLAFNSPRYARSQSVRSHSRVAALARSRSAVTLASL